MTEEQQVTLLRREERPLLTFALFAYNQEKYIREAVAAALAQSYTPLQIILSDDASTDQTFAIMQEMVAGYTGPNEILLNQNVKNLGVGAHVQFVVGLAKGNWLIMAAGDDISAPERCSVIAKHIFDNPNAVAISSGWALINENSHTLPTILPEHIRSGGLDSASSKDWIKKFRRHEPIGTPGCSTAWHIKLFKRFPEIGEGVVAEDVVLGLRAYLNGDVIYISDRLLRYRQHSSNINGTLGLNPAAAIDKKANFFRSLEKSYRQSLLDIESKRGLMDKETFDEVIALVNCNMNDAFLRSVWWSLPWSERIIRLVKHHQKYRLHKRQLRYWIPALLPLNLYLMCQGYRSKLRTSLHSLSLIISKK